MFMHKLQVAAAWMLAIAIVGTGSGIMIYSAVAKDAASGKVAVEQGAQLRGGIISFEGDRITIGTTEDGKKAQKTVTLATDTAILLAADAKGQEATPGKREDLTTGTNVTITLAADGQTARTIVVAGRGTRGTIEAIDKDTITINAKGKDGAQKATFKFNDTTTVILGWGKEKGDVQRGTVADLRPGMQVSISLSAANKELARSITVQPPQAENPKNAKQPK